MNADVSPGRTPVPAVTITPFGRAWSLALAALFYVPSGRKPGVIAYVIAVLRATVLSYAAGFALMGIAGPTLQAHEAIGRLIVVLLFVVFEELSRLGFVIRADNDKRAVWFFCACITVVETIVFAVSGMTPETPWLALVLARAPSILLHVGVSASLLWALRHRSNLGLVMAANILVHGASNYSIPMLLRALGADA